MDYELIFRMNDPSVGSYNVWDVVHGEQDRDEFFKSAIYSDEGLLIAAGERRNLENESVDLMLVAMGRRGRPQWEKIHKVSGLHDVQKIIRRGSGYLVLGNKKTAKNKDTIWLGFFDKEGAQTGEKTLDNKTASISASDIIEAHDGENYMLAVQMIPDGGMRAPYASVYKITPNGKILFGPSFLPGAENKIISLSRVGEDKYIAAGYIFAANGRKAGWLMRLNDKAGIDWQRQYSRGFESEIDATAHLFGRFIITAGRVAPSAGYEENEAGWVMAISLDNGTIGWQRYYTGDINYAARDVFVSDDGMISVLLDGSPSKSRALDYVRLLSINPRGQLFNSNEYFNGKGADAYQLIQAKSGERLIIGSTNVQYTIENPEKPELEIKKSREGWVLVGEAAEPYVDPCVQPFSTGR